MNDFPQTIRIGPAIYSISRLEMADDMGNCDTLTGIIKIASDLSIDRAHSTLLHEILHACSNEYNADVPRKQEEACVRAHESGLMALSYDHPEILRKIFRL